MYNVAVVSSLEVNCPELTNNFLKETTRKV